MKILVIMKRFGANKDMVMENFGRQVRLFEALSKFGHEIDFLCPDYTKHENKNVSKAGIRYFIRPYSIFSHFKFVKQLESMILQNNYEVIVGSTDPLIGILGYHYSKKFKVKYVYDMQDEYSCYDTYKIPFVKYFDRAAVKNSDIVLTVSDSLNKYISKFRKKPIYTIQNGINLDSFFKINKEKARKILRLPKGKIMIYVGEISKFKGVDLLVDAFKKVKKKLSDSYLLLSGKIIDVVIKQDKSIIYEEYPKREEVITALNAADIAVIPNKKNVFSEYCFPYKLLEYMAINLPIVATNLGDVTLLLKNYKGSLCQPDNADDLSEKILAKLNYGKKSDYGKIVKNFEWKILAKKLNNVLKSD